MINALAPVLPSELKPSNFCASGSVSIIHFQNKRLKLHYLE